MFGINTILDPHTFGPIVSGGPTFFWDSKYLCSGPNLFQTGIFRPSICFVWKLGGNVECGSAQPIIKIKGMLQNE